MTVFCTSQWAAKITAGLVKSYVSYCLASDFVTCGLTFWGLNVQDVPFCSTVDKTIHVPVHESRRLMLFVHCWCIQIQNDDELNGGFEWIDDDLGLRPPPPPYPASDVAVISSKVLEGLSVVFLAFIM